MEYSPAAWERAMRTQDVILRAIRREISWFAAADILPMTPRNLRRGPKPDVQFAGLFPKRTEHVSNT
jgi:hypothetical protein